MERSCKTICSYCGVGCGVVANVDGTGTVRVEGDEQHPSSMGMLCSKGKHLGQVVNDRSDRLLYPEMRASRGHPRKRVSWDDAIGRTAAVFRSVVDRFGPDAVALYVSGQLLTEEYYVANKLMKGFIGSNNIDTNSRLCMSSAVVGHKKVFGDDLVAACYEDIDHADGFFIAGANPAWCHPIIFRRIEQRIAEHPDAKMIIVDPRRTASCESADLHLAIKPGTDITLFNAITQILIERNWIAHDYIQEHLDGFDALRESLTPRDVYRASTVCNVPASDIERAARIIAESKNMLTMWAMGLNQSAEGVNKNLALLNIPLITGHIGRPGAGPLSLTGQPNAMGGREVGGLANLLAAHRDLADPEQRDYVSRFWGGGAIASKPGLTATEMIDALETGTLKAIWVVCTNPAVSLPSLSRVEGALKKARFVVVQDISRNSDTLEYADVILPAAGWLEKCGTMTNSERRMAYLPKLIEPPGEARPDYRIFCDFAEAMGWGDSFDYVDECAVFDEHVELTKGTKIDIGGVSYERLVKEGAIQWPCPTVDSKGTKRLFTDGQFATENGRAQLHSVTSAERAVLSKDSKPILLTTGRIRDQWHTMTRTGKVSNLRLHESVPYVEVNPADAQIRAISDRQPVRVQSSDGMFQGEARITDAVAPGTAFVPMHWGIRNSGRLGRANNITSTLIDPTSKQPDYKISHVEIAAVASKPRKIVVIGAGAGAHAFAEAMQQKQTQDTITIIGGEPDAYYNRVMLPGLIAGQHAWPDVDRSQPPGDQQIDTIKGVHAVRINREAKSVALEDGRTLLYDKLVLAMGSEANKPEMSFADIPEVHTLRNRSDAERIMKAAHGETHAVIVGGGLLGVETADAFAALGLKCTLIHRSERLMGRQLDFASSRMLQNCLHSRGITTLLNDGITRLVRSEKLDGVWTRSGKYIDTGIVVWAAGVTPRIAIARESGLNVRQGVVVDRHMRTSDPDVYAIGEVAEFDYRRWGITKAAREQAYVTAAHLSGETWINYPGSLDCNMLKIRDFSLCSLGTVSIDDSTTHEITAIDEARNYYKRIFIRDDRVVGAILVGAAGEISHITKLIESQTELQSARAALIEGSAEGIGAGAVSGQLICSCNGVGSIDIENAVRDGACDLETLGRATCAGTSCGSCRPELLKMISTGARESEQVVNA